MNYLIKRIFSSIVLLLILYLSFINTIILFIFLVLINFVALKEFYEIFKSIFNKKFFNIFISLCVSISYLTFFSLIVWMNLNYSNNYEKNSLIFLLSICILTDTGGYVFGKTIGGKKLTAISPNKTYSGMIGSFLMPLICCYLFFNLQKDILSFEINVLILILAVSLISQLGDLFISYLKRQAKIKDTGSLLPGHGGILDRIDGILLALPSGVLLIQI